MRLEYALISLLLLTSCGGRSMNKHLARDLILETPRGVLEKNDIEVLSITQVSGSEAVAEARLKTAFRLERVRGVWVLREIRIGHGQWEKVDNLLQGLEAVKIRETQAMLDRIAGAIGQYRESTGSLPSVADYISLSDLLSPRYLTPLIRLDAWRRPFNVQPTGRNSFSVYSAGPDGIAGTKDDIIRSFP